MSVNQRNVDTTTKNYLQMGLPQISWANRTSGVLGAYADLGVVDSAELAKELNTVQFRSSASGTSELIRSIVQQFDARLDVTLYRHAGDVLRYMLASETATDLVADAAAAITNEQWTTPASEDQMVHLAQQRHNLAGWTGTSVTCDTITDEVVGVGDGTSGDTDGDFTLAFKVDDHTDVSSLTVTNGSTVTTYSIIAEGAAAAGDEVEVIDGTGATSGQLQFFSGGVATNITGTVTATYTPGFSFAIDTDYHVDLDGGRIRMKNLDGTSDALKSGQPMLADYTYQRLAHTEIAPFSQFQFDGSVKIELLTDVGINLIWTVPQAQIRLSDDAFSFNRDDLQRSSIVIDLLNDGTSQPYGTADVYIETP